MNKQQTAVEWLIEQICTSDMSNLIFQKEIKQALAMEQEQTKRVALHFIVLGGQECGCNWSEINFTDEINKLMNK